MLNVMVEWLTILLHIREVLGSNVGPEISYSNRFLMVFLRPTRQMLG
jgi:hypothetical protein